MELFHVDQSLVRTYFHALHAKVTFLMVNVGKTVDPVKSAVWTDIITLAALAAPDRNYKTISFFHQNRLMCES